MAVSVYNSIPLSLMILCPHDPQSCISANDQCKAAFTQKRFQEPVGNTFCTVYTAAHNEVRVRVSIVSTSWADFVHAFCKTIVVELCKWGGKPESPFFVAV